MNEIKRLVIFAGYDKDNIIDDYVVYYIKELKKIADIMYVCDCNMPESELDKIRGYCVHIMNGRHEEYDFGSYKRGYVESRSLKLLYNYDYLMFINDSVFGPFYDLKEIVESMEEKDFDAWSMFYAHSDHVNLEHLHSYFISIKKEVFLNPNFVYFMYSRIKLNTKFDIVILHECGFTKFLKDNNYKIGGYFDSSSVDTDGEKNLPFHKTEELIKKGFPFFKRSIVVSEFWLKFFNFTVDNLKNIIDIVKDNYDINLMKNNIERVLNVDFYTLLPIVNNDIEIVNNDIEIVNNDIEIVNNDTLKSSKEFILFGFKSNNKYIIIYIFGIKFSIKRDKSYE